MQVRLTDPTLLHELLDFLWHSGFIAELDGSDTVRVSLPFAAGRNKTPADMELFLKVWVDIALRVWNDLWPDADALVVAELEPARRAVDAS